ncbi:calcium-binding protein [Rhodospira trueperi]|uniref:Hemolysin-type calcium-binding repeat-containing protein n=1 Tax=Rhodospira trueperi TaxID=69960 RepID=A0A1G7HD66_9PROT|nr:calcium-binding protein [Rhodospira trueperi]SDE98311.1 hypothetical protein SAMN05421720_1203 [Rhodospira trueperi]
MATDTQTPRFSDRQILDDTTSLADKTARPDPDAELQQAIGNSVDGDDARSHENIHQGVERADGSGRASQGEDGVSGGQVEPQSGGMGMRGPETMPPATPFGDVDGPEGRLPGQGVGVAPETDPAASGGGYTGAEAPGLTTNAFDGGGSAGGFVPVAPQMRGVASEDQGTAGAGRSGFAKPASEPVQESERTGVENNAGADTAATGTDSTGTGGTSGGVSGTEQAAGGGDGATDETGGEQAPGGGADDETGGEQAAGGGADDETGGEQGAGGGADDETGGEQGAGGGADDETGDEQVPGGGADDEGQGQTGRIDVSNYDATDQGFRVTGRNVNSDGTLTEASLDNVSRSGDALGVDGSNASGPAAQLGYDVDTGQSEALIIDFDHPVSEATAQFQRAYANEAGGEQGFWEAYRDGEKVAEGSFKADSGHQGDVTISTDGAGAFDQLVFKAGTYADGGVKGNDASDYLIKSVDFTFAEEAHDVTFTVDNSNTDTPTFDGNETLEIDESGTYSQWGAEITADTDGSGDGETSIGVDTWNKAKSVLAEGDGGADVSVDNFVHAEVRLGDGGDSDVTITGAKRGAVETGDGDDVVNIDADTNGPGWDNTFTVETGDGDDIVTVTGDKGHTRVDVDAGAGDDVVTVDGRTHSADLKGGAGDDTLTGGDGNDILTGGAGDDVLNGGEGYDIAFFSGSAADYTFTQTEDGNGWLVDGADGTDVVTDVEAFEFEDGETLESTELVDFQAMSDADIPEDIDLYGTG